MRASRLSSQPPVPGGLCAPARRRLAHEQCEPVLGEHLDFILQDASVINKVLSQGPTNEVVLTMDLSAENPSGLVWGSGSGPGGPLPAGLPAQVTFVIGQHHPISDVL